MENILQNKSVRCIEWRVNLPKKADSRIVSETFLFQNKNCNLEFYTGNMQYKTFHYLNFRGNAELQLPITGTLRVKDIKNCSELIISIKSASQKIWTNNDYFEYVDRHMTFQLIFYVDYSIDDKCLQTASYINGPMRGLPEDFSKLLETREDHDVAIKCGEDTIKTHKLVLGTRSDVFRAMLQTDMLESRTGVIEIQEMDNSYFREFVRYLYTDEMPELTLEKAKALYVAGDKYNIRSLVLRCAEYLEDMLCSENAFEIYVLADTHSNEKLKESVKAYILEKEVYLQDEHWMPFYKNFPDIALEVYRLSHKKNVPR